jgi:nitroreductase
MVEIHPMLRNRKSGVAFSAVPLESEKLEMLLEAFRWGPSSRNAQPWRIVVVRSPEAHQKFDAALSENNAKWATQAPVKMIILGNPEEQPDRNGQNRWLLDVGLALENLLLQGCDLGLTVHALAGWDEDTVLIISIFRSPSESRPYLRWVIPAKWKICQKNCSSEPTNHRSANRLKSSSSGKNLARREHPDGKFPEPTPPEVR